MMRTIMVLDSSSKNVLFWAIEVPGINIFPVSNWMSKSGDARFLIMIIKLCAVCWWWCVPMLQGRLWSDHGQSQPKKPVWRNPPPPSLASVLEWSLSGLVVHGEAAPRMDGMLPGQPVTSWPAQPSHICSALMWVAADNILEIFYTGAVISWHCVKGESYLKLVESEKRCYPLES